MELLTLAFHHHMHSAYDESSKGTWGKLLIFRVHRIIKVMLENTESMGLEGIRVRESLQYFVYQDLYRTLD